MKFQDDNELDRALLALPLEEPPAGLRASILAATVYKPAFPFKVWEIYVLGALLALIAWFTVMIVANGADNFVRTLTVISATLRATLGDPGTLLWMSLGGSATIWISLLNLMPGRGGRRLLRR
ncbi:MAG: hypothetical protein M3160_00540 [Candidatus Eremiobacteraeota bacterium]|nr:hypothetical protein [Candidatus Eremiobacteraeota bacterium]